MKKPEKAEGLRMYCVFSREAVKKMNGNRGKLAAQAGHAFLHGFWAASVAFPKAAKAYFESPGAKKVSLVVDTEADLFRLQAAYQSKVGTSLVTDAGHTVFDGPTVTCLGIGPIAEDQIGDDLRDLPVLI